MHIPPINLFSSSQYFSFYRTVHSFEIWARVKKMGQHCKTYIFKEITPESSNIKRPLSLFEIILLGSIQFCRRHRNAWSWMFCYFGRSQLLWSCPPGSCPDDVFCERTGGISGKQYRKLKLDHEHSAASKTPSRLVASRRSAVPGRVGRNAATPKEGLSVAGARRRPDRIFQPLADWPIEATINRLRPDNDIYSACE